MQKIQILSHFGTPGRYKWTSMSQEKDFFFKTDSYDARNIVYWYKYYNNNCLL